MTTYFVCNPTADGYSHQEVSSREEADAACTEGSWVITVAEGEIADAAFDTPGVALRAVRRVLKWRRSN